jgi:hypothetical protein
MNLLAQTSSNNAKQIIMNELDSYYSNLPMGKSIVECSLVIEFHFKIGPEMKIN